MDTGLRMLQYTEDLIERDLSIVDAFIYNTGNWLLNIVGIDGIGKSRFLDQIKKYYTQRVLGSHETGLLASEHKAITAISTSKNSTKSLNLAVGQSHDSTDHGKESHGDANQTGSQDIPAILFLNFAMDNTLHDPLKILAEISRATACHCDPHTVEQFKCALRQVQETLLTNSSDNINIFHLVNASQSKFINSPQKIAGVSHSLEQIEKWTIGLVTDALDEQLLTFNKPSLLILLDACEQLDPQRLKWVLEIIELFRNHFEYYRISKHCRVIGASQVKSLPEFTPVDELRLDTFQQQIVNRYLQNKGIDPQYFDHIYKLTRGHPQCLAIIVDIYNELQNRINDDTEFKFLLSKDFYERAWDKLVEQKVLKRLPNNLYKRAIRIGAAAEYFSEDILRAVLGIPLSSRDFYYNDFKRLPYVIPYRNQAGYHTIDPLLRAIICAHEQQDPQWQRYRRSFEKKLSKMQGRHWQHIFLRLLRSKIV